MVEGQVVSIDDYGFNGDDIEAQAFGYLAVRSLKRLPITFPDTTGAQYPVTGGALYVAPKQTKDKDVTNPMKLVASAGQSLGARYNGQVGLMLDLGILLDSIFFMLSFTIREFKTAHR